MSFEILLDNLYQWLMAGLLPIPPLQQLYTLFVGHIAQIVRLVLWWDGNGGSARSDLFDGLHDIRPVGGNMKGEDGVFAKRPIQDGGDGVKWTLSITYSAWRK